MTRRTDPRSCLHPRDILRAAAAAAAALLIVPATLGAQQGHAHGAVHDPAAHATARSVPGVSAQDAARTLRAVFAAAERGDLAALDTLYAGDSLTVVEGTGINRGWADYRDRHLGPELKEMKNFRYRPFELEARASGDVAWVTFRYALQGEVGGRAIDNIGRGTAILERRGGRWVVRHTQTTSRARRPNDPAMPR
jgi:ketosteroid isomerase-like protein